MTNIRKKEFTVTATGRRLTHADILHNEKLSQDLHSMIFLFLDDPESGIDSLTAGRIAADACKAFEQAFEEQNSVD